MKHLLALVLLAFPVWGDAATTFVYSGTPTSTSLNEDVEASFMVTDGNLFVTLSDDLFDLQYDQQVLTGVVFSFTGAGSNTGTVVNPTVQTYAITDKTGTLTASGKPTSANWHTEIDNKGSVTLTNLNNGNHAGSMGIISTSTDPSGTNNLSNHNNFLEGPITFEIEGLGLTSSDEITSVEFNFGTTIGAFTPAVTPQNGDELPAPDPEPATFVLAAGAFGLAVAVRRRLKVN